MKRIKVMAAMSLGCALSSWGGDSPIESYRKYKAAVDQTAEMASDNSAIQILNQYGLDILNFTWEDTGRTKNSALGPNISDMSIQIHVVGKDGEIDPVLMPVVRYPNFTDKSADISPSEFFLIVGNEKGEELRRVSLAQYLSDFKSSLHDSTGWLSDRNGLLAARDTHVLVSAQVSYLPVPEGQKATFNPVLFNYQSSENNSAVLSIMATREGTSATVINNKRDSFKSGYTHGQRLFFNAHGMRASLTGERQSEFLASWPREEGEKDSALTPTANRESGLNMVLLIQVPLKHKERPLFGGSWGGCPFCLEMTSVMRSLSTPIDNAVIGHGELEGPFTEIDHTNSLGQTQQVIERDERFPIRVTVQFYKATTSAFMDQNEAQEIRSQIDKVYASASYVGSLVTEGKTLRPTEHNVSCQFKRWWPIFWDRYLTENSSNPKVQSIEDGIAMLYRYYGYSWIFYCDSEKTFTEAMEFVQKLN